MKIERNKPCPCGSGKKYKRCCYMEQYHNERLYRKLMNGEIPFQALVTSESGTEVSMVVSDVSVGNSFGEQKILNNELELSINKVTGDLMSSKTSLTLPLDGSTGNVRIEGNGSVINDASYLPISIGNKKKLKAENASVLFANVRIRKQRDKSFDYFDVLFGEKHKAEEVNDGVKNRPHIAFFPDGNGKFIRLSGYKCTLINSSMLLDAGNTLLPKKIEIAVEDYKNTLVLEFSYLEIEKVVLVDRIYFKE